jgi:predicted TIM-barrel fold metal-dependent hydrolase
VRIIDSDIHPLTTDGLAAIFPYISAGWRRRLDPLSGWSSAARLGSTRPAGGLQDARNVTPWAARGDALPPNGGPPGSDVGFVIEHHLDGHSEIEVAVLNPIQPLWVDAFVNSEDAATVVSGFNDYFASEWLSRDDRFRLTMTVAPQDAVTAAAEIRRFGDTPGVVAVSFPIMNALLGDPRFYPIYEAAQELGLPISLHPNGNEGDWQGGASVACGQPASHTERYALLSQPAISSLVSLLFRGVFERFPRLRMIFSEYGWTWVPSMLWKMDATWKSGRQSIPWVKRSPTQTVLDQIRFTTQPAVEIPRDDYVSAVLEMFSGDRLLMFSSDYPHWDGDRPEFVFRNQPAEVAQRIFWDNAVEIYGPRLGVRELVA